MDSLQMYESQLNDWMLSNYNYIKTESEDLINYVPVELLKEYSFTARKSAEDSKKHTVKVKFKNDFGEDQEEEVQVEQALSEEKTNDFFKRAEVGLKVDARGGHGPQKFNSIAEKTEHLKNLKSQIEKDSKTASGASMADILTANLLADDDVREDTTNDLSSIKSDLYTGDDEIPAAVLRMAAKANKTKDPEADIDKLREMHDRISESNKNFSGAKGSFSRS